TAACRQVGNVFPPPVAKAIGVAIASGLQKTRHAAAAVAARTTPSRQANGQAARGLWPASTLCRISPVAGARSRVVLGRMDEPRACAGCGAPSQCRKSSTIPVVVVHLMAECRGAPSPAASRHTPVPRHGLQPLLSSTGPAQAYLLSPANATY